MKAPEFLELVSVINQLDHHQRTILTTTLTQLSEEPKVSELIETAFETKGSFLLGLRLRYKPRQSELYFIFVAKQDIKATTLIIVGAVVTLHNKLDWFSSV